jgi:seryl-tRNA(Sec) selenium transferase
LLSPRSLKSIERVNQYLQMTDTDLNEILEEFVSQRQPSHMHLDINSLERIYNIVSDRGAEHLRRQCWSFTTYSDYLEIEEDVTNLEWKEFYQGETYRVARASDICVYAMRNNCPEIYGPEASRNLIRKV